MEEFNFKQPFWVADWYVDPAACRIKRAEEEVKLEPKVMTVLICLAQHAGEVVIREKLEQMAWQDTVVGYDSLASSIIKLRKAFGDDSKNPEFIETVSKRGYRLIAKISHHKIPPQPSNQFTQVGGDSRSSNANEKSWSIRKIIYLFAVLLFMAIIVLAIVNLTNVNIVEQKTGQGKPSIAVLPFKNLSNEPEQDYFSDGMTADLITDLSKISSIAVISRNSVFTYKNINVDARQIRKELGVAYIVEGSVRKVGDVVRISARLIDASNGHNLWADRFDGTLKNIFKLQDEVTQKIVSSLAIKLTEHERDSLAQEYTNSVAAYDEFLHGWQLFWVLSKETNQLAREHFLKAIELDKDFARAYANLAWTYAYDYSNAWHEDSKFSMEQAIYYAKKGVELDPTSPQVHWVMSLVHLFNKDYQAALKSTQQSLFYNPNYADGLGMLSDVLNYAGQPKKALKAMKKAMLLNPNYPHIYLIIRGEVYFNLHAYDDAIRDLESALARNPEAQEARLWLAAAYAHAGDIDSANWQLESIRHAGINLTLNYIENVVPLNDPVQLNHFLSGLNKAGLEVR